MITIYEGSEAKIVTEMKTKKAANRKKLKEIKARFKPSAWRYKQVPESAQTAVRWLDQENEQLKVTKVIPVIIDGHMFNYKLLKQFQNRLKGYQVEVSLDIDRLAMRYWKPGKTSKGVLILKPLVDFPKLKHVPKARIEGEIV